MNNWKTATVFISSTFCDMNQERDVINSYVIPKLNEHFYSRRISVHLVDLRWGVRTSGIEDEVARDNKVLTVCFDEIDRSQPFFVAILGDRYGYDELDKDIVDSISYKFDDSLSLYKKSVTELEILYGSLLHPEIQLSNSVFCMRQTDYAGMPNEIKQEYTQGVLKMKSLRERIVERCNRFNYSENIIEYQVSNWDNVTRRFELFDRISFGELLYAKLVNSISKHFETSEEANFSLPKQLFYEQESFLSSVDNAKGIDKRISILLNNPNSLIVVKGESGIGKSTVLKHLARQQISECVSTKHLLYFNAGLSARCRNVKNMLLCWVWQTRDILCVDIADIETLNVDELTTLFDFILQKGVEQGHEFTFVIDSYELIYKNSISESLPFLRFAKKSFIATQIDTDIHFHRDIDCRVIGLPGLNFDEAKGMMMDLFVKHHKEWNPNLWDAIQTKFENQISPLWIELAVDVLSSLSASDYNNIKALQTNTNSGDEALEKYLLSLVNNFPNSVKHMFGYLYAKVLEEENWSIHNMFYLWYIALSRNGIRESDLATLTKQTGSWDSLQFARIRYRFRSCIRETGVDNCWGFSHKIYNEFIIAYHITRVGERMDADFFEIIQGSLDSRQDSFVKSYIKKNEGKVYVDFMEMLHGSLGHHYIHCERHYDLRISECIYHLINGNDKQTTAFFILDSNNQEGIMEEVNHNVIREIADYIILNHIEEKKYVKVPKGMPIPEFGGMNNTAVIWLIDMIRAASVIENEFCEQLLLFFATDVTEELNKRGAISAILFLNLQIQSLLADNKIFFHEELRFFLSILIANNISKSQADNGHAYDAVFRKTGECSESNEVEQNEPCRENKDTMQDLIYDYSYYYEEINQAQKESFMGNYNRAISICEKLLNQDELFSEKIDRKVYIELKYKCLLCLMDSYCHIGQNQLALDIYTKIETLLEKGEQRWFIVQERLFQLYYETQNPECLDVALQYFSMAEQHFQLDKLRYGNIEDFAHAFVLYLSALMMVDKENHMIETIIMRAERFFSQILADYRYHKQLLKSYSYVQGLKGKYYLEIGELDKAENAFLNRLERSEFLSGREPLDYEAFRDFIKANEDLGYFYLNCENYIKAHEFFTDALRFLCRWDDSEEKKNRVELIYSYLCKIMEDIERGKAKGEIKEDNIRIDGHGYYYMSCKEYRKACEYLEKAINSISCWEDSEEKFVILSELYVALCKAMVYIDENEVHKQVEYSKRVLNNFPLEVKHYFINQLDIIISNL